MMSNAILMKALCFWGLMIRKHMESEMRARGRYG